MKDLKDKYDEPENIELRSEEVQDIMGRPPKWIIRWGITLIFIIIAGLFIGSYFFKYPDVVAAGIEVSTENLPAQLVAKYSGKLDTVFVKDNEKVNTGQYIAIIENSEDWQQVFLLKERLNDFRMFFIDPGKQVNFNRDNNIHFVELQTGYYQFIKTWEDYQYFKDADYHRQKIDAYKKQIEIQKKLKIRNEKQAEISREQLEAQQRLFAMDSLLYEKKAITLLEYENAKNTLLQMMQSYENALTSIDNIQLTLAQHDQSIFDLQQQYDEKNNELIMSLSGAYENLQAQINQWEMQYVFISPVAGNTSFTKQWQKGQHVNSGEQFVSIVPEESTHIKGKILLPSQGSGKVRKGQSVNVKFDGFPYMEFGIVKGTIENISLVPIVSQQDKFRMVEVDFPEGLVTTYHKELDFSQEMSGTAEIITEDLRLIDRFLNPIKAVLKK